MKTIYLPLLAFFALTLTCNAQTSLPPRPSTSRIFPEIGVTYDVTFPSGANVTGKANEDRIKVVAAGNSIGWFLIERKESESPDAHPIQKWINFAFILSAREVSPGK